MKIVIDGSCLDTNEGTGMFRYVSNLLMAWSTLTSDNQYTIVTRTPVNLSMNGDKRFRFVTLQPRTSKRIFAWQNIDLPLYLLREKYDVLFFPTYFIPLWGLRSPVVTVIYDVYYMEHPEWVPFLKYQLMKLGTLHAARQSEIIICGSQYDRNQIVKHLDFQPDRVKIVYGVAAEKFQKKAPDPDFRKKYKLGNNRVISCVGLLFNRRHQDMVVRAFDRLADRQKDICLLLVGKNVTYPHIDFESLIAQCRNKDRIIHVSYLPEEDMVDLYNTSEAVVYISSHEGESFPLREAMACGIPCVTTTILREVCGDAAVYVRDPMDIDALVSGLQEVLHRHDELSLLALSMKTNRTWNNIALETLTNITQACEK